MEDGEESNWKEWDRGAGRKMEEEMMCPSGRKKTPSCRLHLFLQSPIIAELLRWGGWGVFLQVVPHWEQC